MLVSVASLAIACGAEPRPGGMQPPGAGYPSPGAETGAESEDDVRVLSRDDCASLRDRQIAIAVSDALGTGATEARRLTIEAEIRSAMRSETEAWMRHCAGRAVTGRDLRCMKEASTTAAFVACGGRADAGAGSASPDAAADARGPAAER